jgi:hypothetical protein
MKHYEVNFVDQTVETVMSESLPPFMYDGVIVDGESISTLPAPKWWSVTLLVLDAEESKKLVPHGRVHVNLNNVTFIKEV